MEEDSIIDVINESLGEIITAAQADANAAAQVAISKREEAEAAELAAQEAKDRITNLQQQSQELASDEAWQAMYHRLRVWSKEKGNCDPRRNWKSKIDAEEKALGNWAGKQRAKQRQGTLNPFKKKALERLGFTFESKSVVAWDIFHKQMTEFLGKNKKLPVILSMMPALEGQGSDEKKSVLLGRIKYYRQVPKQMLGLIVNKKGMKKDCVNERFTQEKVDFLTNAGLDWQLTKENVVALKEEKGLTFPMPIDPEEEDMHLGNIPVLMKNAWLIQYETLVEFKQKHGHTCVTQDNSSPELYKWACRMREKMSIAKSTKGKSIVHSDTEPTYRESSKMIRGYQAEMLAAINFTYNKADVEWMENYESFVAYKRLFGVTAIVTDKYCSFESLEQWLEDQKREHMNLPLLNTHESVSYIRRQKDVTIPLAERTRLLAEAGAFDVALGDDDKIIGNSNFPFVSARMIQITSKHGGLRRMKKEAEINIKGPNNSKEVDDSLKTDTYQIVGSGRKDVTIDAKTEQGFFQAYGALVAASIGERQELKSGKLGRNKFYNDGRPISLCRIINCFSTNGKGRTNFLCGHHHKMIEGYAKCIELMDDKDTAQHAENPSKSTKTKHVYNCSGCQEKLGPSYEDIVKHKKECGTVEEATLITIPAMTQTQPVWSKDHLEEDTTLYGGEARVLAQDYRCRVTSMAVHYRNMVNKKPKTHDKKQVSALLGEAQRYDTPTLEEDVLPPVKFPTKEDELEAVKLFRRCIGPAASTLSGREKLVKEGNSIYGDGRHISLCRVSGCKSSGQSENKYFCNEHYTLIQAPLSDLNRKEIAKKKKIEMVKENNKKRKSMGWLSAEPPGQKINVVAPPGKLKITLSNGIVGSIVTKINPTSALAKDISPGDRFISIDGDPVFQLTSKEVEAVMAKNIHKERTLKILKGSGKLDPTQLASVKQARMATQGQSSSLASSFTKKPRPRTVDGLLRHPEEDSNKEVAPGLAKLLQAARPRGGHTWT